MIENCKRQLLSNHLELYSDVVIPPTGEYLVFDAYLYEEKGKLPKMVVRFGDDSEWLKPDDKSD